MWSTYYDDVEINIEFKFIVGIVEILWVFPSINHVILSW
jgi:hypothetical protein